MNSAMPAMMPMMGGMMPNMMMPMMNGMMPMMNMPMMASTMMGGMMPSMMCRTTCTMTADGMTCEMKPMDPAMKDMFMQCCQHMMNMMTMGMPMMMNCGGMTMMCMMPMGAARAA